MTVLIMVAVLVFVSILICWLDPLVDDVDHDAPSVQSFRAHWQERARQIRGGA